MEHAISARRARACRRGSSRAATTLNWFKQIREIAPTASGLLLSSPASLSLSLSVTHAHKAARLECLSRPSDWSASPLLIGIRLVGRATRRAVTVAPPHLRGAHANTHTHTLGQPQVFGAHTSARAAAAAAKSITCISLSSRKRRFSNLSNRRRRDYFELISPT